MDLQRHGELVSDVSIQTIAVMCTVFGVFAAGIALSPAPSIGDRAVAVAVHAFAETARRELRGAVYAREVRDSSK